MEKVDTPHWYITEAYQWRFHPPQAVEFLLYANDNEPPTYCYDPDLKDREVRIVVELPLTENTEVKVSIENVKNYKVVVDLAHISLGSDTCLKDVLVVLNKEFIPLIIDEESREVYDTLVQEQFEKIKKLFDDFGNWLEGK